MKKNLEEKAINALDRVTRHGVDGVPVDKDALNYGLEHGLFTQKDVDIAQARFKYKARQKIRLKGYNPLEGY